MTERVLQNVGNDIHLQQTQCRGAGSARETRTFQFLSNRRGRPRKMWDEVGRTDLRWMGGPHG